MRRIRLLATSLLVALSMGVSSCGDDELDDFQTEAMSTDPEVMFTYGDSFSTYGLNFRDYECYGSFHWGNINHFSGLKNNHLWISSYDRTTKEKLWEWTDNRTFDKKRTVHVGYGEYKDIEISSITTYGACAKNKIFVASVRFEGGKSYCEDYILFKTAAGTLKEIKNNYRIYDEFANVYVEGINNYSTRVTDWYKESVFVGNCCYNDMGDTIYVSQADLVISNSFRLIKGKPISYEETIVVDHQQSSLTASNFNLRTNKTIWETNHNLPFKIFSNTRTKYTLLDNSTNIWKYKLDLLYYDGTKKEYIFYLNIDNGTISDTPNTHL